MISSIIVTLDHRAVVMTDGIAAALPIMHAECMVTGYYSDEGFGFRAQCKP